MSLKKIEDALSVLGYKGEIVGFDLASEEGYCTVKLKISPVGVDILEEEKVKVERVLPIPELTPFEIYCREHAEPVEISRAGTDGLKDLKTPEELKGEKESKSRWKTPKPRTAMRWVYFKKEAEAKKFAKEYEKDFEYADSQTLGKDSIQPYKIRKNHSDNDLYSMGYMWSLEFRMNGKDFQVLEQCENLKKKTTGNRAGHCVRYKED